jgi:hypothetical protein
VPRVCALIVLCVGQLAVARAEATQCHAIAGAAPELMAIDAETRLAWIDRRLAIDAARARIWSTSWSVTYAGLTVAQVVLAATAQSPEERWSNVIGGALSLIGVAAQVALPLKVVGDDRWWRKHRARVGAGEDVCSLLNTAELLLLRDAESEAFGVGPLVHAGNFIINIAGGLVLGLAIGRWAAFAYTSLVGIGVGEVMAATQPTDVVEDLRLYRAGQLVPPTRPRLGVAIAPLIGRDSLGAALGLRW